MNTWSNDNCLNVMSRKILDFVKQDIDYIECKLKDLVYLDLSEFCNVEGSNELQFFLTLYWTVEYSSMIALVDMFLISHSGLLVTTHLEQK